MAALSSPLLDSRTDGQRSFSFRFCRKCLSAECFGENGKLSGSPPLLCACATVGHVAVVAVLLDVFELAVTSLIASALLIVIHFFLRCQAKRSGSSHLRYLERFSTNSLAGRCLSRLFQIACHMTPPMWLVVSWMVDDTATRLLSGMLLVSSPQLPCWEVLLWLMMWLGVFTQYVETSKVYTYCCGPAFLLVLTWLNSFPAGEVTESTLVQDATLVRQTSCSLRKVVKSIPDWMPPTQKEVRMYRRAFKLNNELLGVYACSIQTSLESLTRHGRLYISSGHVCFLGTSVMSLDYRMAIERHNIQEVKCEASKEGATLILGSPTFIKGSHAPVTAIQLFRCERGLAMLAALSQEAQGNSEEDDDGLASTDAEDGDQRSSSETHASAHKIQRTASAQIFADGEPFQKLFDAHLPEVTLDSISSELADQDWGDDSLIFEYLNAQGATQVSSKSCIVEREGNVTAHIRELTMMMPVPPAPMCPRVTKMTITYRVSVSAVDGRAPCIIESSAVSHDVPFGSNFLVQDRIELVPAEGCDGVKATKSCRVVFLKSCGLLQSRIKSAAVAGQVKFGDLFVSLLRNRRCERSESTPRVSRFPSDISTMPSCCFSVWELQRRITLFHSDWHAPFLPHEGKLKWRWVDDAYRKHHWITTSRREDAAAASYPPLNPGDRWIQIGEWTVSMQESGTDTEGWQYSIDFYRTDSFWGASPRGYHVRRRLWTCNFAAAEEV